MLVTETEPTADEMARWEREWARQYGETHPPSVVMQVFANVSAITLILSFHLIALYVLVRFVKWAWIG